MTCNNHQNNVTFTINSENHVLLPDNVETVIISNGLNQSVYQKIFCNDSTDQKVNVILSDSIEQIENEAFKNCNMIKSITVPLSVTRIGKEAFSCCSSLKKLQLPESINEIDDEAFLGCTSLEEVYMPDSVTKFGRQVFQFCYSLKSVRLSMLLESIKEYTFSECLELQSIVIPSSVITIEKMAFGHCYALTSVVFQKSVTLKIIDEYAFYLCTRLQNIVLPKNCAFAHDAFKLCNEKLNRLLQQKQRQPWIKHRFDSLPLHQICYDPSLNFDQLIEISTNDASLHSVDKMKMTPLHILSCNPNATIEMIKELVVKCPSAAFVKSVNGLFPVDMYLLTKNMVTYLDLHGNTCTHSESDKIRSLFVRGSNTSPLHAIIKSSLEDDLMEILLAYYGTSMTEELSNQSKITGMYPFMTAAVSNQRSFDFVYKMAIADPVVVQKYASFENKKILKESRSMVDSSHELYRKCFNGINGTINGTINGH